VLAAMVDVATTPIRIVPPVDPSRARPRTPAPSTSTPPAPPTTPVPVVSSGRHALRPSTAVEPPSIPLARGRAAHAKPDTPFPPVGSARVTAPNTARALAGLPARHEPPAT
jgi:hypothetical protein